MKLFVIIMANSVSFLFEITINFKVEKLNQTVINFPIQLRFSSGDANTPGQELYNWLIKSIEKGLIDANVQTIIYVPDRQLRYIPLATIYDGKQWLIESWRFDNRLVPW